MLSCSPPLCAKAGTGSLIYFPCHEPKSWTTPEVTLRFLQLNCNLLLRAPSHVSTGQGGQLDLAGKSGSGTYQPYVGPALPEAHQGHSGHVFKHRVTSEAAEGGKFHDEGPDACRTGDRSLSRVHAVKQVHRAIWHASGGLKGWTITKLRPQTGVGRWGWLDTGLKPEALASASLLSPRSAVHNLFGTRDRSCGRQFFYRLGQGDVPSGNASDGDWWEVTDKASLACPPLTSWWVAQFLSACTPVLVSSRGLEDPCPRWSARDWAREG